MARVVVTGGAGFLGSHLCAALLERDDEVVAIDNLITGSRQNLRTLEAHEGFSFVHHDVSQPIEGIEVVDDPYAAVEGAEVLAVLTEWDEFRWLDIDKVADLMAARNVVDARNLLDRAALTRRGFDYVGVGRS